MAEFEGLKLTVRVLMQQLNLRSPAPIEARLRRLQQKSFNARDWVG